MNNKLQQQNVGNNIYTAEVIEQLKSEAEEFINEICIEELEAQLEASNKTSLKDFIPASVWKRACEASEEESSFVYVISSLNKIFGIAKKHQAQTFFESMLSLGILKLKYSLNWLYQCNSDLSDYTKPSDIGKLHLEILCKVTQGTDENERKRTDIMMKKILHEIANKTEKSTRKT